MRKTTKEMIEVMQAFDEGKLCEYCKKGFNTWRPATSPTWNWDTKNYRIKKEPRELWFVKSGGDSYWLCESKKEVICLAKYDKRDKLKVIHVREILDEEN